MTGASNFMERFDELSNGQRELLSRAEHDVSVWKEAYATRDSEVAELRKELAQLKIAKLESGAANPLLLCLIDGDGCIFNETLLMLGKEGGRDAASRLRQHIAGHYGSSTDILVHIFFNREGLGKTIKTFLKVGPATFDAFISGFNTASPLMSMLDVGTGKEAADAKIRELMRIFVRYPHVKRIYFGGGHDNGYNTNLTTLHNEGYLDKIILLQGYTQLAAEIKALGLPCLENDGLFLTEKLSNKTLTASNGSTPAPATPKTKSATKSPVPPPPPPAPSKSPVKVPSGKNTKANVARLKALSPRACNHHYLTKRGCGMDNCPYGHDYKFSPDMLADLRELVKQNPCPLMNKGKECVDVECPSAHQCPQGPNCTWHKHNTCKFTAPGMHGTLVSSEEDDDDHVLVPPHLPSLHNHNRTGSSSSSLIDFLDYPPAGSPSKKFVSARPTPSPAPTGSRTQVKNAFKNSVSGTTTKERLQQMGVGSASALVADDDLSDSSEQQQYARTQHPYIRAGAMRLVSDDWDTPTKYAGPGIHRGGLLSLSRWVGSRILLSHWIGSIIDSDSVLYDMFLLV